MLVRRYEMPWRRAYEVYAGIAWWLALLYFLAVGVAGALPRQLALPLALVCFAMSILRVAQALVPLDDSDSHRLLDRLGALLDGVPADTRSGIFTLRG